MNRRNGILVENCDNFDLDPIYKGEILFQDRHSIGNFQLHSVSRPVS